MHSISTKLGIVLAWSVHGCLVLMATQRAACTAGTGGGGTDLFGPSVLGVLGVLLVLGVEVVDGILHDVAGVHGLLQRWRDALQWHGASVSSTGPGAIHTVGEGEAQSNSSQEHLQPDEKVLPACWHGTHTYPSLPVLHEDWADHTSFFQDRQNHACCDIIQHNYYHNIIIILKNCLRLSASKPNKLIISNWSTETILRTHTCTQGHAQVSSREYITHNLQT